jgi:hypothetical protein
MKPVVAGFVKHPQQDKEAAGQSDGQPEDIDAGINLLSEEVPEGDLKIVCKHISSEWFGTIRFFAFEHGGAYVRQHFSPIPASGPLLSLSFNSPIISFMQITHHLFQQMRGTEMLHQIVEPARRMGLSVSC